MFNPNSEMFNADTAIPYMTSRTGERIYPIYQVTNADIERRAQELMTEHHIIGAWKFRQMTIMEWMFFAPNALMGTDFDTNEIIYNPAFTNYYSVGGLDNAIKHEIAHVLAGVHANHGPDWQAVAVSVGAAPYAVADARLSAEEMSQQKDIDEYVPDVHARQFLLSEDDWLEASYEERYDYDPLLDDPEYFEDDFDGEDEPMTDQEFADWQAYRETVGIY